MHMVHYDESTMGSLNFTLEMLFLLQCIQ